MRELDIVVALLRVAGRAGFLLSPVLIVVSCRPPARVDGAVRDPSSGLIWTDVDKTPRNWHEARRYCADLGTAGAANWRLPTLAELESIFEQGAGTANNRLGLQLQRAWSSDRHDADDAWTMDFGNGDREGRPVDVAFHQTLCLRDREEQMAATVEGRLVVRAVDDQVTSVWIDSMYAGFTPLEAELEPGPHRLEVGRKGCLRYDGTVEVAANLIGTVDVPLDCPELDARRLLRIARERRNEEEIWNAVGALRAILGTRAFEDLETVGAERWLADQEAARLAADRGDAAGTVQDLQSGLMWRSADNAEDVDWSGAEQHCSDLRTGRFSDWRLPTLEELDGLYLYDSYWCRNGSCGRARLGIGISGLAWSNDRGKVFSFGLPVFVRREDRDASSRAGLRALCVRRRDLPSEAMPDAAPRRGLLTVMTTQWEWAAKVSIDGRYVGSTPFERELPPGRHRVQVERVDCEDFDAWQELPAGASLKLIAPLPCPVAEREPAQVVDDPHSGLQWALDEQPGTTLDWLSAHHFCERLSFGSFNDWRMPSLEELQSVEDVAESAWRSKQPLTRLSTYPEKTLGLPPIWSATRVGSATAWSFSLQLGARVLDHVDFPGSRVLCVRAAAT